jgi:hypothetical protein
LVLSACAAKAAEPAIRERPSTAVISLFIVILLFSKQFIASTVKDVTDS